MKIVWKAQDVFSGLWWKWKLFPLGTSVAHPTAKTFSRDVTQILAFPPSSMLNVLMSPASIPPHFWVQALFQWWCSYPALAIRDILLFIVHDASLVYLISALQVSPLKIEASSFPEFFGKSPNSCSEMSVFLRLFYFLTPSLLLIFLTVQRIVGKE